MLYFLNFFTRRTFLAIVVVHTMKYLFFQIFVMNFTITFSIIIVGYYRVFQRVSLNKAELANEICMLIMQYSAIVFSDFNKDPRAKNTMGYVISVSIFLHLFFNLYFIIRRTVKQTIRNMKIKRTIKKMKKKEKMNKN